jgi:hypothetical protein
MAQAFKFPTEANGGHRATPPFGAWRRRAALLDRRPDKSGPSRIDRQQYGPAPGSPQARKSPADAATAVPIPGPGDPAKVNQSGPI